MITMKRILLVTIFLISACWASAQGKTFDYVWIQGIPGVHVAVISTVAETRTVEIPVKNGGGLWNNAVQTSMIVVQEYEQQGWELFQILAPTDNSDVGAWVMRRPKQ
jgi:hypothetical protein